MDNENHKSTWNNFTKFVLWGSVAVISVLVLILFIILKIFSLNFYLILSVAVLFAVSNFVLMPMINKFRDEKQDKKFKQSHFISVVINFVQMILLVIMLI